MRIEAFNLLAAGMVTAACMLSAGCTPEVLLARSDSTSGSGGTAEPTAGSASGGGGSGGTRDLPSAGADEGGAAATPAAPRLLADSVADFSFRQGEHGWYYGYDGGSLDTFALMTRKSIITTYVPASKDVWDCWANDSAHWTQLFQLGGHPNGTTTSTPSNALLQRAVRRWVSNYEGKVVISGEIAKIDVTVNGSNGIDALVYVDGLQLYTTPIGGEDGGGLSYEVPATLVLGSSIDFVLDPHENDDHHDLSRFTSVIERAERALSP